MPSTFHPGWAAAQAERQTPLPQPRSRTRGALRGQGRGFLVITHYDRLLAHLEPDHVHVLAAGRIVRSGGRELARELEQRGYGWLEGAA